MFRDSPRRVACFSIKVPLLPPQLKSFFFSECSVIFVCGDDTFLYVLILSLFIYLIRYQSTTITTNIPRGVK